MILTIIHGNVLDPQADRIVGERSVVVEDGVIVDVVEGRPGVRADVEIDARGRYVLPGFVDAHVHLSITTMDFPRSLRLSEVEWSLAMAGLSEAAVQRGFTTVRDAGGAIRGLVRAINRGLCRGPRVVRAGRAISQTGGHGDIRPADVPTPQCGCEIVSGRFSHVADGADAVRKAARHELRDGSDFLKIMSSGGVASPTDPFDSIQYTGEEVRAITIEAEHRNTYVTSHAYSPEAIRLAVDHGVRCIEHGNLLDDATAAHLATLGVTMVPTLITYRAMDELGAKMGIPRRSLEKNRGVFAAGQHSIEVAKRAGVDLGFGTDLLGEAQPQQNQEFLIRAELEPAVDVLHSMYVVNPRLCGLEGQVGVVQPGAYADLLVSEVDPIDNLPGLADPGANLSVIIRGGEVVKRVI
jgi:imidazolonepropionase-like amidohydrolase